MNLKVEIGKLQLNNPLIAASGTYGFGKEYGEYLDLNRLGGLSGKGITKSPRAGNPPPRIAETPSGILNSVGLENPGLDYFIENEIPFMRKHNFKIFANVAGDSVEDYKYIVKKLSNEDIDAIELNVSCPNVNKGCIAFGATTLGLSKLLKIIRKSCTKTLIVKLTPNVTNIKELAYVCQEEGADGVSLINTLLGLAIDIEKRRPILKNNYGGLSGPAIKPIALRMVNEVYNTVDIPIIGMGGISNYKDVIEFMLAGSKAVMVGTCNFSNPTLITDIEDDLKKYLKEKNISNITELTGKLRLY